MGKTNQEQTRMTKEAQEEAQHFKRIIYAFKSYKRDSEARLSRANKNLKSLPLTHQQILNKHGFKSNLESLQSCIDLNYRVLSEMIAETDKMFDNRDVHSNGDKNGNLL